MSKSDFESELAKTFDVFALKEAYDKVANGRHYVPVWQVRRACRLTRYMFDLVLTRLLMDGLVTGHQDHGDGSMTDDQRRDCLHDGDWHFYTITWK